MARCQANLPRNFRRTFLESSSKIWRKTWLSIMERCILQHGRCLLVLISSDNLLMKCSCSGSVPSFTQGTDPVLMPVQMPAFFRGIKSEIEHDSTRERGLAKRFLPISTKFLPTRRRPIPTTPSGLFANGVGLVSEAYSDCD